MSRIKHLLFIPILISWIEKDAPELSLLHSNRYYSIYASYNEKTHKVDSIITLDTKGHKSTYALKQNGIGEYPKLYKTRLISIVPGRNYQHLTTFDLLTHKIDTLCSEVQFLTTDAIDEYEGKVVVRSYDNYKIVDVSEKKILKQSKCYLENILLTDSGYFLIRTINDISEPKPYLCTGTIAGEQDRKLIDLPDMGVSHYSDATTLGWNGMKVYDGVLFIHMMHKILAYDIEKRLILDTIDEEREVSFHLAKSTPVFLFEKKEKLTFNMKAKRFKRS